MVNVLVFVLIYYLVGFVTVTLLTLHDKKECEKRNSYKYPYRFNDKDEKVRDFILNTIIWPFYLFWYLIKKYLNYLKIIDMDD